MKQADLKTIKKVLRQTNKISLISKKIKSKKGVYDRIRQKKLDQQELLKIIK